MKTILYIHLSNGEWESVQSRLVHSTAARLKARSGKQTFPRRETNQVYKLRKAMCIVPVQATLRQNPNTELLRVLDLFWPSGDSPWVGPSEPSSLCIAPTMSIERFSNSSWSGNSSCLPEGHKDCVCLSLGALCLSRVHLTSMLLFVLSRAEYHSLTSSHR